MKLNPQQLSFGAVAAERDITQGLADYFVESESFRRFKTGVKTIALGNRGAGKTAIFKILAEQETKQGAVILELTPEDYSYEFLTQTVTSESHGAWAKQGEYTAAWKFLLYLLSMKSVINAQKGFRTGPAKRLYNYLRDNHKGIELTPIEALVSYLNRLQGIKLGNLEASMKARQLHQLYKLEEIEPFLEDLNLLCQNKPVVILIDELDRGWDASEDAKAFVAGLFQAATSICVRTPNIRVFISLRREIYETIPALYEDAQKVRDIVEVIEWDEQQLLELISNRIAFSFPELNNLSPMQRWNAIFPDSSDYKGASSFSYIIDRTLFRPRELIQFCIDIRNRVIGRNEAFPINFATIEEIENTYSQERAKDIAAEYRFQYPGLLSVFETFRGFPCNLDRDALELHCLQIATKEILVDHNASWCLNTDPEQLIEILWQVGFLRAEVANKGVTKFVGPHQIKWLNLRNVRLFEVHHMFRAALGVCE